MAHALIALIGQAYYDELASLTAFPPSVDAEEAEQPEVEGEFGATFKEQLVKARRGHTGRTSFDATVEHLLPPRLFHSATDEICECVMPRSRDGRSCLLIPPC
jgi:hypothetical protein